MFMVVNWQCEKASDLTGVGMKLQARVRTVTCNDGVIDLRLWPGPGGRVRRIAAHDPGGGDTVLPSPGDPDGEPPLLQLHRHLVCGLHLC